ncbi:MAG: hypothetical protein GY810_16675 [Aureispira sp.]|nr:hypothetical protein [Aureispira sp.]
MEQNYKEKSIRAMQLVGWLGLGIGLFILFLVLLVQYNYYLVQLETMGKPMFEIMIEGSLGYGFALFLCIGFSQLILSARYWTRYEQSSNIEDLSNALRALQRFWVAPKVVAILLFAGLIFLIVLSIALS